MGTENSILEQSVADGMNVVEYNWAYKSGSMIKHIPYQWDLLTMLQTLSLIHI